MGSMLAAKIVVDTAPATTGRLRSIAASRPRRPDLHTASGRTLWAGGSGRVGRRVHLLRVLDWVFLRRSN
jgi:hypothetical protein